MKEILYALVLAAIIGWVTVCNGQDVPACAQPCSQLPPPARQVAPLNRYGFPAMHYRIHSSSERVRYDTVYTLAD